MRAIFPFPDRICRPALASLTAKTVPLAHEGITIEVPDNWMESDLSLQAASASQQRLYVAHHAPYSIEIIKMANPRNIDLDSSIMSEIKVGLQRMARKQDANVSFGDEGPVTVGGAPAYAINFTQSGVTGTFQIAFYAVDANQKIYLVFLATTESASDPKLQAVIDSLRFDKPPSLPESTLHRRARKLIVYGGPVGLVLVAVGGGRVVLHPQAQNGLVLRLLRGDHGSLCAGEPNDARARRGDRPNGAVGIFQASPPHVILDTEVVILPGLCGRIRTAVAVPSAPDQPAG